MPQGSMCTKSFASKRYGKLYSLLFYKYIHICTYKNALKSMHDVRLISLNLIFSEINNNPVYGKKNSLRTLLKLFRTNGY